MGILLAFAPFIVFAITDRFVGPTEGLIAGAVVSLGLLLRDWLTPGRSPKILEIGTALLFGGLAAYALVVGLNLSVIGVRLVVDVGLLVIVLVTMLVGRPFTLQYAREQVPSEHWEKPEFIRTSYVITAAWALALAVIVLAEIALLTIPDVPQRAGIIVIVAALVAAVKFTGRYPRRASERGQA